MHACTHINKERSDRDKCGLIYCKTLTIFTSIHTHTHTRTHTHAHTQRGTHTYTHTHIHMNTNTHMHACTHIQAEKEVTGLNADIYRQSLTILCDISQAFINNALNEGNDVLNVISDTGQGAGSRDVESSHVLKKLHLICSG